MSLANGHFYEFGRFRLEVGERRLLRAGEAVPLAPKAFDLLVLLVENHGSLLDRARIIQTLWPDSFVEEANLAVQVSALRKALGEGVDGNRFIETVPKRGYRFVAEVTAGSLHEPAADIGPKPSPSPPAARRRWLWVAIAAILACAAGIATTWVMQSMFGGVRSVAVLPFRNLTGEPKLDYVGLGMADAIITRLARLGKIEVRSTSAVQALPPGDPHEIGRKLMVDALLEGRLQQADKRIRVTVQLVRVKDGRTLWADAIDDYFSNIFAVQDVIAERLIEALSGRLSESEHAIMARRGTEDIEAYRLYLQGQYMASKRLNESTQQAIEFYRQAIARDPDYPLPYAALAFSYLIRSGEGLEPALRDQARGAAMKALSLDDQLAEAHLAAGNVMLRADWDWNGARRAFDRAEALSPNLAAAHAGKSLLAVALGGCPEAIREMTEATRLDPASAPLRSDLAWVYQHCRDYGRAWRSAQEAVALDPQSYTAQRQLGKAAMMLGQHGQSVTAFEQALGINRTRRRRVIAELAKAHVAAGQQQNARQLLSELETAHWDEPEPFYEMAVLYAATGRREEALHALEQACRLRLNRTIWMGTDPELDPLRGDPRFARMLAEMRLPNP